MNISDLVTRQRRFFDTGATRPLSFRLDMLKRLRKALLENEALFNEALKSDLNKSMMESYMSEIGMVLEEIRFHIKHLPRWI
jgi:aldehyde dehydrogenase (NAD+)